MNYFLMTGQISGRRQPAVHYRFNVLIDRAGSSRQFGRAWRRAARGRSNGKPPLLAGVGLSVAIEPLLLRMEPGCRVVRVLFDDSDSARC